MKSVSAVEQSLRRCVNTCGFFFFFLVLFLKAGKSLGLIDCMAGGTRTSNKQPLWQRSVKAESCRAATCYTSLAASCLPAPLTFWPLGGSDISPAQRLWLLIQEVIAMGEMQHFLVSEL